MAILVPDLVSTEPHFIPAVFFDQTPLAEMLRGVTAEQIKLISLKIGDLIGNRLGVVPKAEIDQIVREKKGVTKPLNCLEHLLQRIQGEAVKTAKEKGELKLLSEDKQRKFVEHIHVPIQKAIANALSTTIDFLNEGIAFSLSTHDPVGVLAETAQAIGVEIPSIQVPEHYTVELHLDEALSQQALVFSLIEKSRGIEFHRENFTV